MTPRLTARRQTRPGDERSTLRVGDESSFGAVDIFILDDMENLPSVLPNPPLVLEYLHQN